MVSRRRFIATTAALVVHPLSATERDAYTAKDYGRATVIDEQIAAAPDVLIRIRRADDLRIAKATKRLGLIYNVQDTSLLENDLSRVTTLRALGLRVMQMTYNTRNLVGDGCLERADSGLSNLGRELVAELNRSHVVMDLSHSGRATIAEAIRAAKAPPVISHTGCRDLHDHPRNVYDDDELRALADKGGVAGIYFMPFLRQEHESRVARGIAAPGESPDVHQFILEYNHPRRFFSLAQELSMRGWAPRRIDKLLGGNFARVYAEVWG